MRHSICILGLVLFLAACGGSGGGGDGPLLPTDPPSTQSLTGLQPPSFSDASISPTLNAISAQSDSLTVSDLLLLEQNGNVDYASTDCSGTVCLIDFHGERFDWDTDHLTYTLEDSPYSGVGEKNGVHIAQNQGTREAELRGSRATHDFESYGAWLEHNAFVVRFLTFRDGVTSGGTDLSGLGVAYGLSAGNDTGTPPTGSATWRGIMVGGTAINGPLQVIQGDATVTYDLEGNELDVAFTDVYNLETEDRFQEMRWSELSVSADGSFRQETVSRDIEGRFYGPDHAEVGGTFLHTDANAIGAFGARR